MRHTIEHERDLPTASSGAYVRCSSEPSVVTHPVTGDAYQRADGKPWPHAGYRVDNAGVRPAKLRELWADPGDAAAKAAWGTPSSTPPEGTA